MIATIVISQQAIIQSSCPQILPRQLGKSQIINHFGKQNGQKDTKGNMTRRGSKGKKYRLRKQCVHGEMEVGWVSDR